MIVSMIVYKLVMLRYISILLIMLVRNVNLYRIISVISIMNMIVLMNWPTSIKEIYLLSIDLIIGYKISISYNYIGIYMSMVLDLLIWISLIYERYYIRNDNHYNILLLYIVNNVFFSSNDMITLGVIYEFQNIPLLLIINNIYNKITLYNKKGIGISNILLILYGIISGLLLYNSMYYMYLYNNNNNISYNVLLFNSYNSSSLLNVFASGCAFETFETYGFGSFGSHGAILQIICICMLLSGSIKLAIFPFHIWLGKVHVEAPTIGSIILAGIALKTGFYIHYLFINLFIYINPTVVYAIIYVILIGVIINNLNIFYQIDMKRWIALYSIVHMNLYYDILFIVIYTLAYNYDYSYIYLIIIIIYGMIGHSLISAGLFLVVGYLYDYSNNKNLIAVNTNIVSSYLYTILFLLLLGNSSFPFFLLFVFELLAFTVTSLHNIVISVFLLFLSLSNLLSSLYIFYKYFYTNMYNSLIYSTYSDLVVLILSVPILAFVVLMGLNLLLPISFLLCSL